MELPNLGQHCSQQACNKLDFLPIKCDVCREVFCDEHYFYTKHNCANAYLKDNQVPVCPLCNKPIPVGHGQEPDRVVGAHIDDDCQSDPAKSKRRVFTNKCSRKGCKVKEVVPVICEDCGLNYCLKHRHVQDHQCQGRGNAKQKILNAALARQKPKQNTASSARASSFSEVHGTMSEDEALARALALSMQDAAPAAATAQTQEELDLALARQLQASEYHGTTAGTRTNNRDRCVVI